eukprot:TRINITY_DN44582_c0_g1_i1.p1 TRINITY_DN44582_c0_g1~~TRINITY_DN44582_c0_g1_i1.p1  ORF type:complete len:244 (+),score=38.58 TRINITY_DN44582_c0_g1_i1:51-782(+)
MIRRPPRSTLSSSSAASDVYKRQLLLIKRRAEVTVEKRAPLGVQLVICSDTHGKHRDVVVPPGDVFLHAGDFTRFGKLEDVEEFNVWLGELPHAHKIVINGNHEHNAEWKKRAAELLPNATLLRNELHTLSVGGQELRIFGTDFCWPMKSPNPYYDLIPEGIDVLMCHGPVQGYVDGGTGCQTMLEHVKRTSPRVVVSGHIHHAHGVAQGTGSVGDTLFVNAANAGAHNDHRSMAWDATVVDL